MRPTAVRIAGAILFSLIIGAGVASADMERRFPHSQITTAEWRTYLAEVKAKPGAEVFAPANQPDAIGIAVDADQSVYYFTKSGPAHPAVVVVHVYERDGETKLQNFGYFAGSETGFAAWFNTFRNLGPEIQARLKAKP